MNTKIFLGPPGTGKTTTLLGVVDERLRLGIKPHEIGFVSFTRKAVEEARERAVSKFQLPKEAFPYFATIHGLAFRRGNLRGKTVIRLKHYQEVGDELGVEVTRFNPFEEGGVVFGATRGDRMFKLDDLARVKMTSLEEVWRQADPDDITIYELIKLREIFRRYKQDHDLVDYTDMLEHCLHEGNFPDLKVLIVDEAQDLSRLQWQFISQLKKVFTELVVAGDDDQAIYEWSGADYETIVNLPGEVTVLSKSYRVPKKIHELAQQVITRVKVRRPKRWDPKDQDGTIRYYASIDEVDMAQGSWLLLSRNKFMLEPLEHHCREMGYAYQSKDSSPLQDRSFQAIKLWQQLVHGKALTTEQVIRVYDYMTAEKGYVRGSRAFLGRCPPKKLWDLNTLKKEAGLLVEGRWTEALTKVREEDKLYFLNALSRGEDLHKEPRLKVSTIHGVKGGEADHVLLLLDMSFKTWEESLKHPESEVRVWYVAMTRARTGLHLVAPKGSRSFDL